MFRYGAMVVFPPPIHDIIAACALPPANFTIRLHQRAPEWNFHRDDYQSSMCREKIAEVPHLHPDGRKTTRRTSHVSERWDTGFFLMYSPRWLSLIAGPSFRSFRMSLPLLFQASPSRN